MNSNKAQPYYCPSTNIDPPYSEIYLHLNNCISTNLILHYFVAHLQRGRIYRTFLGAETIKFSRVREFIAQVYFSLSWRSRRFQDTDWTSNPVKYTTFKLSSLEKRKMILSSKKELRAPKHVFNISNDH
jgi:hypothetical protein